MSHIYDYLEQMRDSAFKRRPPPSIAVRHRSGQSGMYLVMKCHLFCRKIKPDRPKARIMKSFIESFSLCIVLISSADANRRRDLAASMRYWLTLGEPWAYDSAIVTTCGGGGASHNGGSWKPKRLIDGVAAMAKSARKVGSRLPILILSFTSEPAAHIECTESSILQRAGAICHELDDTVKLAEGYGYPKITAIIAAPARTVLYIDADAWFVENPDPLLRIARFGNTGALFWPDYYNHFKLPSDSWERIASSSLSFCEDSQVYYDCNHCTLQEARPCLSDRRIKAECVCDRAYLPHSNEVPGYAISWPRVNTYNRSNWAAAQGFDSALLVIDKARTRRQLHRLDRLSRLGSTDSSRWAFLSNGDKDLWHLAWMLDHAPYELNPFAAHVASRKKVDKVAQVLPTKDKKRKKKKKKKKKKRTTLPHEELPPYKLVSQAKCDADGNVIALHQNWRQIGLEDSTALVVADLRLVDPPFNPEIEDGFRFPKKDESLPRYLRNGTHSPVSRKILKSLASIRQAWGLDTPTPPIER